MLDNEIEHEVWSMPLFGRQEAIPEINPDEVQARLVRGERVVLLDVREPAEFRESHIAGSRLIPLDQLPFRLDDLPRDRPIVAICRSGNRSAVATTLLRRAGFDASNMRGGMLAWHKRGFPVDRGDR
jgi:rhodanese-related sulfurtransferase